AAPLGGGAVRHRHGRRVRARRVPAGSRGGTEPTGRAMSLNLPALDVPARLPRLRARFGEAGIDALLVTRLPNVPYLTGFTGPAGMLLVRPTEAVLVTDGRYEQQAGEQLHAAGARATVEIAPTESAQRGVLVRAVSEVVRLGLESHGITWARQR